MVTPLSADQTVRKSILKAGQIRRKQLLRLHLKWLNADLNSISAPADLCFQDASWRCTSPDGSSVRSPHHTFHASHYLPAENGCGCCPGRRAGPAHWYPTHNGQENNPAVREIKKKKWQKLNKKKKTKLIKSDYWNKIKMVRTPGRTRASLLWIAPHVATPIATIWPFEELLLRA